MNKDEKRTQRITIDLDTKSKKALQHARDTILANNSLTLFETKTKRGYHLTAWLLHKTWWEACCIRFIAGDDRKRLYLDLTNDTKPHNVLFDKKKRIKVKTK